MKIWLSKNSEVPVREQIYTQITLGITSGDLPVGEKLPSTQEIARRFKIHSNTVSNAYQILAENGWIEFKKGSGFFVCEIPSQDSENSESLEGLFADFFNTAQSKGFSKDEIKAAIEKRISAEPPEIVIVIESDKEFCEILIDEVSQFADIEVRGISFEEFKEKPMRSNAVFCAMSDEKANYQNCIPTSGPLIFLNSNSVAGSLTGQTRPSETDLIAIVSGWKNFLIMSKTILLAANLDYESLIIRSTSEPEWQNGLESAAMIICDSLTSKSIEKTEKVRVFPLIAKESLENLRKFL